MFASRHGDTEMVLAGHPYMGRSVGSEETCHQFPTMNICFDLGAGALSCGAISQVFITHGHEDHAGGLPRHALRRDLRKMDPATYHVPAPIIPHVRTAIEGHIKMGSTRLDVNLVPVETGSEFGITNGMTVKAFRATHSIPCWGYGVWSTRKRLKPELVGTPGQELARLKREGHVVDDVFHVPEVVFPGDTSIKVVYNEAVVREARVLLLECTFVDDRVDAQNARDHGHIHIDDFIKAAKEGLFKNEVIMLTHFSARYDARTIRSAVDARIRDLDIADRIQLLLPGSF